MLSSLNSPRRLGESVSEEHFGLHRTVMTELIHHRLSAGFQRDQAHSDSLELSSQCRSDHSARPGAPAHRHHFAARATARLQLSVLVQHFVGHAVVHLTRSSEASGHGREENHGLEVRHQLHHGDQAVDLGGEHRVEHLIGLLLNLAVGQDSGAVDQAGDRTQLFLDRLEMLFELLPITHVSGQVKSFRSGRLELVQSFANLSLGEDLAGRRLEVFRCRFTPELLLHDSALERFFVDSGIEVERIVLQRSATQQDEA